MSKGRFTARDRIYFLLLFWYLFIYFYECVFTQYLQKYMKACGLSTSEIGTIISVATVLSIIAQPLWARAADRARYKNTVLFICSVGGTAIGLLWLRVPPEAVFFFILAVYAVSTLFRSVVLMLCDTICLEILARDRRPFGPVRLMGALGWAIMGFIAGQVLNRDIFLFGPACLVLAAFVIIIQLFVPKTGSPYEKKDKLDLKGFFGNPKIMPLIVYLALIAFSGGISGTYFYLNFEQLGGNASSYGTYLLIVTLTEIPFLFFADRILRRVGVRFMLAAVGAISFFRLLYIYFVPSYKWLFGLAFVHGFLVLNAFVVSVFFTKTASPGMKATSLTIAAVTQGIFRSIGTYTGGLIISRVFNDSFQPAFLISAVFILIAVLFLLIGTARVSFDD